MDEERKMGAVKREGEMSGDTGRITEITEEELRRTYEHGIALGLEMAQKTMLERAGLDFCAGNDQQANCLRAWANIFKNMAEKERPGPIKGPPTNPSAIKLEEEDICGLCGLPGADKYAHPIHWPGEAIPDGPLVHMECEKEECRRAHVALADEQRIAFLRTIR